LGESKTIRQVLALIDKVAPTDATVLLQGESGVGKELVAKAIPFRSKRRYKPFVKVSCAAISESLLEVELFGREKGAYTEGRTAVRPCYSPLASVFPPSFLQSPIARR